MDADLNACIAMVQHDPQHFREGRNLSDGERAVVQPQDLWKIALIKSLDTPTQDLIKTSLGPLHLPHYLAVQRKEWLAKELYLLGKRLGRPATMPDLLFDLEMNNNPARYRLCYALNFPLWTGLCTEHYIPRREVVDVFLALAEILHPCRYPYYSVLWGNHGLLPAQC